MDVAIQQYSSVLDGLAWACEMMRDRRFREVTAAMCIPHMNPTGYRCITKRLNPSAEAESCAENPSGEEEVARPPAKRARRRKHVEVFVKQQTPWQELIHKMEVSSMKATTMLTPYLLDVIESRTEPWLSWNDIVWHLLTEYQPIGSGGGRGVFGNFVRVCNETAGEQDAQQRRRLRQMAMVQDLGRIDEGTEFLALSKAVRAMMMYKASLTFVPVGRRDLLAGKTLRHLKNEEVGKLVGVGEDAPFHVFVSSDFTKQRELVSRWRKEGHKLAYLAALTPPGMLSLLVTELYSTRSSGHNLIVSLKLSNAYEHVRRLTDLIDSVWTLKMQAGLVKGAVPSAPGGVGGLEASLRMHQLDNFWVAVEHVAQCMATELMR